MFNLFPLRFRRKPSLTPLPKNLELLEDRMVPAGTITGFAFEDFNANGVRDTANNIANSSGNGTISLAADRGLAGVTLTAFDAANTAQGSTTTAANGSYILNATGTGPYRVEFSTFPAGFFPGPNGADNGTSVRFLPDGNSPNINLGLVKPSDYSEDNPLLVTSQYVFGDQLAGANAAAPVLVSFPYSAGSNAATFTGYTNPTAHAISVRASAIGTTWGLGYSPFNRTIYASAFMKKHAGFGPNGTGAIYQINRDTGAPALYADLNTIFGAGTAGANAHNTANYNTDNFNVAWDAVGKSALGGLDVSEDGSTLYVMNLADRSLYALPTTGPLNSVTVRRQQIPAAATVPGATGGSALTPLGDLRPFAVQFHDGQLYIGMVNSAETTQNFADMKLYVYTVDPVTLAFSATPVFQMNLNYPRGQTDPGISALWRPWIPTFQTLQPGAGNRNAIFPQPMLTGIAFDETGNMVLGLRDRNGDQSSNNHPQDPANPAILFNGITAGDTLRAFGNPTIGWTLENNSRGPAGQGTGPQNTGQGPGIVAGLPVVGTPAQGGGAVAASGEFYFQDNLDTLAGGTPSGNTHDELSVGGVLQIPGFPDLAVTSFDPAPVPATFNRGGVRWHNNTTGGQTKGYEVFSGGGSTFFAKANGVGDLTFVPNLAPLEIGNRVFRDSNRNGRQDANEAPIGGVVVQLFRLGLLVGSATTDGSGQYFFNNANVAGGLLPNTAYEIRIANAQAQLAGLLLTTRNAAGTTPLNDSNFSAGATFSSFTFTTGGPGQSDHTLDAGFFQPVSIGNLVWNDLNNNGTVDAGEPGIANLPVRLFDSTGTVLLGTMNTNATGNYLFTGLPPGTYIIEVDRPTGFVTSTGSPGNATGPNEPAPDANTNNTNNDDNGSNNTATTVRTTAVAVLLGTEPTGEGLTPGITDLAADADSNTTVDFGFFQPVSIGNLVWNDLNNNGTVDAGENGIPGVTVRLFNAAGNVLLATTTTNATGNYLFSNLAPGTYVVEVVRPAGLASSTGSPGSGPGPFEPAPNADSNNTDNDDNGTIVTANTVRATVVALAYGTEPTGEPATLGIVDPAADADSNTTVDFGFFRPLTIGNLVWNDLDNSGTVNGGEVGIANLTVQLRDVNGNVIATTTTNATGNYLFTNLTPGTYSVAVIPPGGFVSSTGANGSPTGPFEPGVDPSLSTADNDDNGTNSAGIIVSGTLTLTNGGQPTGEPATPGLTDNAADNDSNVTVDFGLFQAMSLGNLVWNDVNNNGVLDGAEQGLSGLVVRLLDSTGNTVLATTTTNVTGNYLFSNLVPGDYIVEVDTPAGFTSSTGVNGGVTGPFEPAPDPDVNITNEDDNGSVAATTAVRSSVVTLALGTEPTGESATPGIADPALDGNSNTTVDFGFFQTLSLGNLVWNDLDNNGVVDPGEPGLPNLTVNLFDSGNNLVATTTTNATGNYLFTNLLPGTYTVALIPPAGFQSSTGTPNSATGPFEPGADPNNGVDNDDNGSAAGASVISTAVVLAYTTEPTGEPATPGIADNAADNNSDATVDFGLFQPMSLGNLVWNDANNNGVVDGGEQGIPGLTLRLLDSTGNTVLATTTTNATGNYLFTNLGAGDYILEVLGPSGFTSSTGSNGNLIGPFEPAPDPDTVATDNDDNGSISVAPAVVRSSVVTLALGTEPTGEAATPGLVDSAADNNSNTTVDFGFFQPLSIGNFVWNDVDNNGVVNPGEPGIPNATVNLFDSGNNLVATTTTNANGNYLFTNLLPGTYTVALVPPAGFQSSTGINGSATGPFEPGVDPNTDVDFDDNGSTAGASIVSGPIVLAYGTEPTGEPPTVGLTDNAIDINSNATVDFGLFQPLSIGNLVWNDVNNNGVVDGAEQGIQGVAVRLLDSTGATVIASTTTNATGNYLFQNLIPGTYIVEVDRPAGFATSTGTPGSATGPFEPAPNPNVNPTDSDDNGSTATVTTVRSTGVVLSVGAAPIGEPPTPGIADSAADANSNATVDFGFFQPLSIGNLVWNDANNNGVVDGAEQGIAGLTVRLLDSTGNTVLATTTTNVTGNYLFTNLGAGDYILEVDGPAGFTSSTGTNGSVTGPVEPAADPDVNPTDNDDNGSVVAGVTVRSSVVTLALGTEPTGEPPTPGVVDLAADASSNTTVDFGFFQPLSIGNFVWNDVDNNGIVNPGEPGLAGITVNLFDSNNNLIATTTTNANGNYLFTNLLPGTYTVALTPSAGFQSSTGTNGSTIGPFEPGANPNNGTDFDDNGSTVGASVVSFLITLSYGTQPTGEPPTPGLIDNAADNNSNSTIDFGLFQPLSLGNLVWNDVNNNGVVDLGEPGIANVTVRLFDSTGVNLISTTTTNATGNYLFQNLVAGTYIVEVDRPSGTVSSTGAPGSATGPFEPAPNANVNPTDSDDNGSTAGVLTVRSAPVTLALGGAPVGEPPTPGIADNAADANSNATVDFGFFQPLSLGNLVWNDVNNNGVVDPGESGVPNLVVNLRDTNGNLVATTTTNATGNYLFTDLPAGTYTVELTPPLGFSSSTGSNGAIGPFEPGANPANGVDFDDNGSNSAGLIVSAPVTLGFGTAPSGEPATPGFVDDAADADSNVTVDFGLFQPLTLGNLIWNDINNNGLVDPGEPGIANVTVNLLDSAGTAVLATTSTNGTGNYLFTNLAPGDYIVEVVTPTNFRSSSGTAGSLTGPNEPAGDPDDNVDNNDDGTIAGTTVRSQPIRLDIGQETTNGNANLTVDFGFFVPPNADVSLVKTVAPNQVVVGDNVTYRLTVNNVGPASATSVIVNDALPPGLTFVSANASIGAFDPVTGQWTIGTLRAGQSANLTIQARVIAAGSLVNNVRATFFEADPNLTNNTSNVALLAVLPFDQVGKQLFLASTPALFFPPVAPPAQVPKPLPGENDGIGSLTTTLAGSPIAAPATVRANMDATSSLSPTDVRFVQNVYQVLLGHAADQANLVRDAQRLAKGVSRSAIVRDIWESDEHRARMIDSYHQLFFGRPATEANRDFWINKLSNGMSDPDVIRAIAGSSKDIRQFASREALLADLTGDTLWSNAAAAKSSGYTAYDPLPELTTILVEEAFTTTHSRRPSGAERLQHVMKLSTGQESLSDLYAQLWETGAANPAAA